MLKSVNLLKFCAIAVLWCLSISAWAQGRLVTGTITSADENSVMPGVSILEKGTNNGVISDSNGKFSIQLTSQSGVLVLSFVGYATQEVAVGNNATISVVMQPDAEHLDELVVIGYGTVKKADLTGSVDIVNAEKFNRGVVNSPQELIAGKMAGVSVTSISGAPGQTSAIRIRGGASLTATNDPLIVIDDIPITNNQIGGSSNILSTINPNDIETFTVLKDASATAIYGSRASNGVIIITTKRGAKTFKINYNATATVYTIPKKLDVYTGDEFRELVNQQYAGQTAITSMLGTSNTDWQDEIYKTAFGMDHNLNISGTAFKKLPYRVSINHNNTDGVLKTYNFKRTTASIGLDPTFFNNSLRVSVNVKGMINDNNFADQAAIGDAIIYDPTRPVFNGNTSWGGYTTWTLDGGLESDGINLAPGNPVARLALTDNTSQVKRSIGNVKVDYDLPVLTGLSATLNLGYDVTQSDGHNNVAPNTQWVHIPTLRGGRYNPYTSKMNNTLLDFYLKYSKDLKSLNSKLDITGGYSYAYFHSVSSDSTMNFAREGEAILSSYRPTDHLLLSFFGRANYAIHNKYLITATFRSDASSRFSPDLGNAWGFFPSVALAWKMKEEKFLQSVEVLSDLKLRVGYGITGQQDVVGGNDYNYLPLYTRSNNAAMYQLGEEFYNTIRPDGYDANYQWEKTSTANAGFDFGFLKNRITGTLDVYYKWSDQLISFIDLPTGTNFFPRLSTNIGKIENYGVELNLNAEVVSNTDWQWDAGFNITYNNNEVTKLNLSNDPNTYVRAGGIGGTTDGSIQVQKIGAPRSSFYVYQQVYNADGTPAEGIYADRNDDGVVNEEDLYLYKKPDPTVFLGVNSRVTYKQWDFSFSGRANLGNYAYNNVAANSTYGELYNSLGYLRNMSTHANETRFISSARFSDIYIENASFFRMDNINLGYTFNNLVGDKINLRVGAGVQNVFVITKYSGLDPEISGGLDNNFFPRTRSFLLNLNCTF